MKKTITILLALMMVLSLAACGGGNKPKGVYAGAIKYDEDKWMDLGARYEFKGSKVIQTDLDGIEKEGKVTYDGDNVHLEFEDGTHGDYTYDKENDVLVVDLGEMTGSWLLVNVKNVK